MAQSDLNPGGRGGLRLDFAVPVVPLAALAATCLIAYGTFNAQFTDLQDELLEVTARVAAVEATAVALAQHDNRLDRLEVAGGDRESRLRSVELGMVRQDEKLVNILAGIAQLNTGFQRLEEAINQPRQQ